ncbi:WD40-repeat-containing domain protein, partial [Entophlyctis helioformis]
MAASASAAAAFHLSDVLEGHSQDVRALVAVNADTFASASRDRKVIIWQRIVPGEPKFVQKSAFAGHEHFVNSLAYAPPSATQPLGLIYSGGSDKMVYAFDPNNTEEAVLSLAGHTDNVCVLAVGDNGDVISGSWDKTAKVWRNGKEVYELKGHAFAVWGVLVLGQDLYATASADKTIKLWNGSKNTATLTGHTDVVRSLVALPGIGFASCSNDGSIRVWNLSGETIAEYHGHTSFVYSLARLSTGEVVSSGEDRTVRVWNESGLLQTLTQPCVSVWCVASIPNGDIVAGGSDGFVRVFSRAAEPIASSSIPSNQVGDVDKNKLPGLEALNVMGTKDGQVKMVRVGNAVEAHQWSASQAQWIKIGEVVDAVGNSRKQVYQGKEYDFVFDVDVYEGAPPLKLPYNNGTNPYQAAQEFIDRNEIGQDFLDQIANFITQNTASVTIGAEAPSQYVDPFTGGSRYVPGGPSGSAAPYSAPAPQPAPAAKPTPSGKMIPMQGYSFFKTINFKAVLTKILQLNGEMEKSMDYSELSINADQERHLEKLIQNIESGKLGGFGAAEFKLLSQIALDWPEQYRFPGIDLMRVTVLYTKFPTQADSDFIGSILRAAGLPVEPSATLSKAQETNAMLAVRTLTNLFAQPDVLPVLYARREDLVSKTRHLIPLLAGNKNVRLAIASLYLNLIVLVGQQPGATLDDAFAVDLLETVSEMLQTETDGEALIRELVALGTLLSISSRRSAAVREAAGLLDVKAAVQGALKRTGQSESKLRQAEQEVLLLL